MIGKGTEDKKIGILNLHSINLKSKIRNLKYFLLDILFPIQCLGCKSEGEWVCCACKKTIPISDFQVCPICKSSKTNGSICETCKNHENIYFDKIIIATKYEKNHLIQKTIKTFKYRFIKDLNIFLSDLISQTLQQNIDNLKDFILIPVPLHKKRQKWRGFNQSELLAEQISQTFQIQLRKNLLTRIKNTKSQAELHKKEREENLCNAFIIENKNQILNKNFILIDDICSTSTTLNECAKVLKESGAKEVICAVVGRG